MTTLCPAVQEGIKNIKESISHCQEGEYEFNYKDVLEHQLKEAEKCATLQAEWERERVKEAIDKINYYSYDGEDENSNPKLHKILAGFLEDSYIRTEDFIVFLKELGIEQEEKKK